MKYGDLHTQRNIIWGALRNLLLQAENNGGAMTRAQMAAFDRLHRDLDEIDRRLYSLNIIKDREMFRFDVGTSVTAAPAPCDCGYTEECYIWCGNGHETGECTGDRHSRPMYGIAGRKTQKADDYDYYRELYATTGDEAAKAKMLDCVTIE